jgi:Zn-dependent protease
LLDELYILPILLFSVVIHETAHGWMALRLGDTTARDLGRLTLNPIPHIDPIGSVIIPLFSLLTAGRVFIAWAKPVPINPNNFSHVRRDDILVSIVGPVSNFILAFLCTVVVIILAKIASVTDASNTILRDGLKYLLNMFAGGITLNIVLGVFNLIPVPPLDGSHVVASLLPSELSVKYRRIGFAGILIILLLMRWEPFSKGFSDLINVLSSPFQLLINAFV